MRVRLAIGVATLVAVLLGGGFSAYAQGNDELTELRRRVAALEAEQKRMADQELEEISKRLAEEMGQTTLPEWVTRTKLKGDFRYRHELIDDDASGRNTDRNRQRIRARLGIYSKVNDDVDVGIRLATGGLGGATSTNQTLTGAFGSKAFNLDRAYFDYHPGRIEGLHVIGGKMANVFNEPVGNSDLIWDGDVNPEGLAAKYSVKTADESMEFFVQGGGFYATENRRPEDQGLFGGQAGVKVAVPGFEGVSLKVGGGYYDYANVENGALLGTASGNQLDATGVQYNDDYDLVEGFAELGYKGDDVSLSAFGHAVRNTAATCNKSAWLAGGSVGYKKFKVTYNYRTVDQNSIIGSLADGDFLQGGINGNSHKISLGYNLSKNWDIGATAFISERGNANLGGRRVNVYQLDLKFKF